jgi:lipopolysaccharide biosynthesis regulator YciM
LQGLVNIAQYQQNWQKVIELSKVFIGAFPDMWQGYWWLGNAYRYSSEYGHAAEQFETSTCLFPTQHQGLQGKVNIEQHQQNWKKTVDAAQVFVLPFQIFGKGIGG